MDIVWDGITRVDTLDKAVADIRFALADASKYYDWHQVVRLIAQDNNLINTCRLQGKSLFTPLHQAANGNAPIEIVRQLIDFGAFRTLQNAQGERPIDVAERKGHKGLYEILKPDLKHRIPYGVLLKIQSHFHEVIRKRIDRQIPDHNLRLPELEPLLELERPSMWFPVPGMYGGFSYRFESTGVEALLISESWCRVLEGSGERHEVTSKGSRLVEKGFV